MSNRPGSFQLDIVPPIPTVSWRAIAGLLLCFVLLAAAADVWWRSRELLEAQQAMGLRAARTKPQMARLPALSEKDKEALRREIAAVNRPIRQLNQSWDGLLSDIRSPPEAGVRVLSLAVDSRTNAVRIVALAANVGAMADYADVLASRHSLSKVILVRHEKSRDDNGLKFTLEAQWTARD